MIQMSFKGYYYIKPFPAMPVLIIWVQSVTQKKLTGV